jgi:hypothetical protein
MSNVPSARIAGSSPAMTKIEIRSRDAAAPELCQPPSQGPKPCFRFSSRKKGRRSADRRTIHCPRRTNKRRRLSMHRRQACAVCANPSAARKRVQRDALASRRSTAALVAATERFDSAQAVLRAIKTRRHGLRFCALKRSTPRAGRNAGGTVAWTARERGYKPRPQEPHSLHQSAVTGRRP